MKRSEALAILSRDHHHALVVAQKLKRADTKTARAARAQFLAYWDDEGRHHFQLEEELLLPAFAGHGDARHPLVLRVLGDHVTIRSRAAQLAATAEPAVTALHELGSELSAHVRLEERGLFPVIEAAIPAGELLALARALDRG
jgi:iron-sulfur cluster repair protein YtfE (RIC family)